MTWEQIKTLHEDGFEIGNHTREHLGVSIRTLYRDIASLRAQGASIDGEPGLGYVLRPGFLLPPLMFPDDEIEALVLGSRWVAERADPRLAEAARNAIARIGGALPAHVSDRLEASHLIVGPPTVPVCDSVDLALVRRAIRTERKLRITYRDAGSTQTHRLIWPFLLGFFDGARLVSAWCELREDIRHFRTDRIVILDETSLRYPRRRHELLRAWRAADGISPDRR
jgi:predicted DNA-binding transcriptional regulator YafY